MLAHAAVNIGDLSEYFLPGSLVYENSIAGDISLPSEEDTFVIELDENQTITAVVNPAGTLQAGVYICGPDGANLGSGIADFAGDTAIAQTISAKKAGAYTIHIYGLGDTTGSYDVGLTFNAAEEQESHGKSSNDSYATAESIDGSFISLSDGAAFRGAVLGESDASSTDEDWFSISLDAGCTASLLVAADPGELQEWPPAPGERPHLELYDSQGTMLAMGVDIDIVLSEDATALGHSIEHFVSQADETFYARVVGQDLEYALVITIDAALDLGNNSNSALQDKGPAPAPWEGGPYQDISGRQGVLGEIGDVVSGWTFMVYLDADNNLEGAGIEDFLEMATVGSTEEVNIVVQIDRAFSYDYSYDNWTGTRRGLVNEGDVPDQNWGNDLGEIDMGDPQSVIDFVEWSMEEYPAGNYALIYWDHGNGIEGVCTDSSSGSELEMTDLTTIIDATEHVNLIGFDACLMAMTEIAYQYRNGADVMLASEATEWLDGWEYQNFLDKLVADPTMTAEVLAGHVIDAFEERYNSDADSTLSSVDLTKFASAEAPLIDGLNQFADWMINSATPADWNAIETASDTAKRWSEPNYIDLGDFISRVGQEQISPELADITSQLLDDYDSAVLINYGGTQAPSTGLSIYLPQLFGYVSATYNNSLDFVADTHWDEFITADRPATSATSASSSARSHDPSNSATQYSNPLEPILYGPAPPGPPRSIFEALLAPYYSGTHRKGLIPDGSTQSAEPRTANQESSRDGDYISGDWYSFEVAAGDWITAWTTTPGGDELDFRNAFDPYIELYAPGGQLLAADDNTVYGRNALISYSAKEAGRYWIRVDASPLCANSTGQYFLRILGPNGPAAPLAISSTSLPHGSKRFEQLTSVTVEFSDQILLSTLDASALTIDGTLEAVDLTVIDGNTIIFTLPVDIGEGSHTLEIAEGSIQDIQGTPVTAYTSSFEIDTAPPRIVDSSIQQGDSIPAGQLVYQAVFDQSLNADVLDTTDVILTNEWAVQIEATSLNYDPQTFTVSVQFPTLGEGNYSLRLLSGDGHFEDSSGTDLDGEPAAFPIAPNTSGDGTAGGDFIVDFSTEINELAISGPAQSVPPGGSLIRLLAESASIGTPGDLDTFVIDLQAGQTLATSLHPADTLVPMLVVIDPDGNMVTSVTQTAGEDVFQQAAAAIDGSYKVLVTGTPGSVGDYDLQLTINAGLEAETYSSAANNTLSTAESLDGYFISLADTQSGRTAVLGSSAGGEDEDFYSFSLVVGQTASVVLNSDSGNTTFELLDSHGNLLAVSANTLNADAAIHGFAPTTAGTYYLRLTGESDYSMVVTRNVEFERESNNALPEAQILSSVEGVLGSLDDSADDWYQFQVDAGETIAVETFLPLGIGGLLGYTLDPAIELYDPQGILLAADGNSAADGINAIVVHEATQSGTYSLRVSAEDGQGDYYVSVDTGDSNPGNIAPQVVAVYPNDGSAVSSFPITYTVDFSEQLLLSSLQPGDLTVEGAPALAVTAVDGDTVSFELDPQLYATHGDGIYHVLLSAGAVDDLQGAGSLEYSATFTVDNTGPRITATTWNGQAFPADSILPAGRLEFEAVFDEDLYTGEGVSGTHVLDPANVLLVEVATATSYTPDDIDYDAQSDRFKVVYDYLPSGNYAFVLVSQDGGFEDVVGNDLDGEFGSGADGTPTGNGIPGGSYSTSFTLSSDSRVVGRHIFYNNSHWDGNSVATGTGDDAAIATDKSALLPGETATFANYTSYEKGINGIMIDVENFLPDANPTSEDFIFRVGNNSDPATWTEAPQPLSIALRRGAGEGGSDRITIVWTDGAISKQWLQVTLIGQQLGLDADDIFYWGNAVGETGDHPTQTLVNATDILAARDNPSSSPAETTAANPYDFNRDGLVNATDVAIAQLNKTSPLTALRLFDAPSLLGTASRDESSQSCEDGSEEAIIDQILRDGLI